MQELSGARANHSEAMQRGHWRSEYGNHKKDKDSKREAGIAVGV